MNDQLGRRIRPPEGSEDPVASKDDLPPSGRRYGAPAAPPRRLRRPVRRLLVALLTTAVAAAVIAAVALAVLNRPVALAVLNRPEGVPRGTVDDPLAGVSYTLPPGWSEGLVAPVTGFTSVAAKGDQAVVMARPGEAVDPPGLRSEVIDLSDLYGRLLLHGERTEVVDDRAVTIGGRPGHTRAVRIEYRDVVNEQAFLRVTLLIRPDGGSTILLGVAHPDDPRSRADIETVMRSAR